LRRLPSPEEQGAGRCGQQKKRALRHRPELLGKHEGADRSPTTAWPRRERLSKPEIRPSRAGFAIDRRGSIAPLSRTSRRSAACHPSGLTTAESESKRRRSQAARDATEARVRRCACEWQMLASRAAERQLGSHAGWGLRECDEAHPGVSQVRIQRFAERRGSRRPRRHLARLDLLRNQPERGTRSGLRLAEEVAGRAAPTLNDILLLRGFGRGISPRKQNWTFWSTSSPGTMAAAIDEAESPQRRGRSSGTLRGFRGPPHSRQSRPKFAIPRRAAPSRRRAAVHRRGRQ